MIKHELLFGKYHLLQPLGSGGFATVYLAEHVYLETYAAIKVLRSGLTLTSDELERFHTEAQTIAQLRHPHIVRIRDFAIEDDIPYLVMDYAPNGSLHARHRKKLPLEPELVLTYVKQMASALQFAHDRRVVHCDVKPENMLVNENDDVLLSDFGISIIVSASLKTRDAIGTMHYMAPEQFDGKPVPASDQYALAVVAYCWLCGQLPFNSKNPLEMYHLHSEVPPKSLQKINPRIPPDIDQVILKALSKKPENRFTSVQEFAVALEQAMQEKQLTFASIQPYSPQAFSIRHVEQQFDEPQMLLPSIGSLLPTRNDIDQHNQPSPDQRTLAFSPAKGTVAQNLAPHDPSPNNHLEPESEPFLPQPTLPDQFPVISQEPEAQENADIPPVPRLILPDKKAQSPSTPASIEDENIMPTSGKLTYDGHTSWVFGVVWSPNGTQIASASWDNTVQVWSTFKGILILIYRGHTEPVKSVSWSPDGKYIASGSWDKTIQVWDANKGSKPLSCYSHEAQVEAVAWSPDGSCIASAGHDGYVHVWRATSGRSQSSFGTRQNDPIWALAWSPNGKRIVSCHNKTVYIWEALTGKLLLSYDQHENEVRSVAWSADGQRIASSDSEDQIHIWSADEGRTLLQLQQIDDAGSVNALAWSPDGTHLASGVKTVQIWNMMDMEHPATIPEFTYKGHTNWVNALAWSPDGQSIASASDDKTVQVWMPG